MRYLTRWNLCILLLCSPLLFTQGCDCGGGEVPDTPDASTTPDAAGPDAFQNCGDSLIHGSEECDDGNMSNDDECLNDCTLACGDGVVNAVELCDTGIPAGDPGACPTDCDDGNACTQDVLVDNACRSECILTNIETFVDDDGCCPPGGNNNLDNDCAVTCGNGVVETGELCDTAIAMGDPGECPTDCDDGVACTADALLDPGTCLAQCENTDITLPADNDGCCPTGANAGNDNDCSPACGDGVVSPNETCDIAIAPGNPGACPEAADCVDGDACTEDNLISGGTCNALCANPAIVVIGPAEGCCPPGGNANNDPDCQPVCGNGVLETGEACDDGNTMPGDGCDALCQVEIIPTGFRIDSMVFRDPHAFTQVFFFCTDITGNLNTELDNAVTADGDGDGLLDLSLVGLFRPLDQALMINPLEIYSDAECTAPLGSTTCTSPVPPNPTQSNGNNQTMGTCLQPNAGTVRPYNPGVTNTTGPCFVSDQETFSLDIGGIIITLTDAYLAGTYVGNPATSLVNGLMMGFISEADADSTILPMNIPLVGGQPLSSILPGGAGNCNAGDDRDVGPGGVMGWYFYLNFTATAVPWTDPP